MLERDNCHSSRADSEATPPQNGFYMLNTDGAGLGLCSCKLPTAEPTTRLTVVRLDPPFSMEKRSESCTPIHSP